VRARDRAGFLNLYTEDAVLMIPNLDALQGHAGAARFFEAFENRGIAELRLRTIEVEDFGHAAWERGRAEQLRSDGSVLGRSQVHRDMEANRSWLEDPPRHHESGRTAGLSCCSYLESATPRPHSRHCSDEVTVDERAKWNEN
jgi:hypothetical protein